jgi:hypothetical protein
VGQGAKSAKPGTAGTGSAAARISIGPVEPRHFVTEVPLADMIARLGQLFSFVGRYPKAKNGANKTELTAVRGAGPERSRRIRWRKLEAATPQLNEAARGGRRSHMQHQRQSFRLDNGDGKGKGSWAAGLRVCSCSFTECPAAASEVCLPFFSGQ